jgi:20S proteasome alpha/beta subunit
VTLIVGLRCSDGVVVGADGAATYGITASVPTIRQPTEKLQIISDRIIIGTSGPVGLGQKFAGEVSTAWAEKKFRDQDVMRVMSTVEGLFRPHIMREVQVAQAFVQIQGPVAAASAMFKTVVALPVKQRWELIQFDEKGAAERATDQLPFVTIGGGQSIADPFLAFLRRIFWPDKPPNLSDGVFAVLWTLRHAIDTNPGGVADPIQIMTLLPQGGDLVASELSEPQLEEHKQYVDLAEARLRDFRKDLTPGSAETVAEPPEPK